MRIEKKDTHILITPDEDSFEDFYRSFSKETDILMKEHIIIQLSDNLNTDEKEISLFLDIVAEKKKNSTSFIVVATGIDVDVFPETFNIVPTLKEAEDVLDMEAIERDLGF